MIPQAWAIHPSSLRSRCPVHHRISRCTGEGSRSRCKKGAGGEWERSVHVPPDGRRQSRAGGMTAVGSYFVPAPEASAARVGCRVESRCGYRKRDKRSHLGVLKQAQSTCATNWTSDWQSIWSSRRRSHAFVSFVCQRWAHDSILAPPWHHTRICACPCRGYALRRRQRVLSCRIHKSCEFLLEHRRNLSFSHPERRDILMNCTSRHCLPCVKRRSLSKITKPLLKKLICSPSKCGCFKFTLFNLS